MAARPAPASAAATPPSRAIRSAPGRPHERGQVAGSVDHVEQRRQQIDPLAIDLDAELEAEPVRALLVGQRRGVERTLRADHLPGEVGVDFDKVQTGPLKAEPDINDPLVGEVRASLQSLVDDSFQWFVDIVAERRGLPRPETLALSDGRILTGRQALTDKLIDAIGGESEAIAWLESDKAIGKDLPVADAFPLASEGWFGLSRWLGQGARQALGLDAAGAMSLDGLVSLWQAAS